MARATVPTTQSIALQLRETGRLHAEFPAEQVDRMARAAELMVQALRGGRKVLWCGNGGSATQGQHMAAEFVGRFARERRALPSASLTENMASVTAIGNDYAFDDIFSRQLEGLAQRGDVLVGLSTSGNSRNVIRALRKAKELGVGTIGLTGQTGGQMAGVCDVCICVPSTTTARVQEVHLTLGHILCGLVEDALLEPGA
jgi:D-sedoheptulose 7-phosphate isomerase